MTPFSSVAMLEKLALLKIALCSAPAFEQRLFRPLARGHVFHGQDEQLAVVARLELAGVEQHHPPADDREGVLELEVVEDGALGDDVLEQGPQVGDVPLAVAQLVDEAALGLRGRDVERLVEGAVGRPDAQRGVEDQQRLAHRVHDVLGVVLDVLDDWFSRHRGSLRHASPFPRSSGSAPGHRPAQCRGRWIVKVVPRVSDESTSIRPPCPFTISLAM